MPRVMLFARRPRAGRVKTRLAREIGDAAALTLYRGFLDDLVAALASLRPELDVELWLDGPWSTDTDGPAPPLPCRTQGDGELGERLARGVAAASADDSMPAVLLGSDAPTLPLDRVRDAVRVLAAPDGPDVAVEPADDGGYVLLAVRRAIPELFESIPWGGASVLRTTLDRAAACGAAVRVGEGWYDVDDRHGLERLRAELRDPVSRNRAPRTAAALADLDRAADGVV